MKYRIDKNDSINFYGRTLYRIVALKDFSDVKAGDKGGYVQSEETYLKQGIVGYTIMQRHWVVLGCMATLKCVNL